MAETPRDKDGKNRSQRAPASAASRRRGRARWVLIALPVLPGAFLLFIFIAAGAAGGNESAGAFDRWLLVVFGVVSVLTYVAVRLVGMRGAGAFVVALAAGPLALLLAIVAFGVLVAVAKGAPTSRGHRSHAAAPLAGEAVDTRAVKAGQTGRGWSADP